MSPAHTETDTELMQRIATSDQDALAALYDRHGRLVMSVALAMVNDWAMAEEITLDVFMSVWQSADRYNPRQAGVATWLSHMAHNRTIDRLRREAVRPAGHSVTLDDDALFGRMRGDAESAAIRHLQRERVRSAVVSLPADQRQALTLAFFQGYTHSEIAGLLHQSLGTVKGHIYGGMVQLRKLLAAEEADDAAEYDDEEQTG